MSTINSQTNLFPQSNNSIQGSGLTYFVNNVSFEIIRNLKRIYILIANFIESQGIRIKTAEVAKSNMIDVDIHVSLL